MCLDSLIDFACLQKRAMARLHGSIGLLQLQGLRLLVDPYLESTGPWLGLEILWKSCNIIWFEAS